MRWSLLELQDKDKHACKLRAEQLVKNNWQDINNVLYHQGLFYVPEIIQTKLINRHHNNLLVGYFGIEKIQELVAQKYNWPMLCHDIDDYVKGYDICLTLKAIRHKPYRDL